MSSQSMPGAERLTAMVADAGAGCPDLRAASPFLLPWMIVAFVVAGPGVMIVASDLVPDAPGSWNAVYFVWPPLVGWIASVAVARWQQHRISAQTGLSIPASGWIGVGDLELTVWRTSPRGTRIKGGPVSQLAIAGWSTTITRTGVLVLTAPTGAKIRLRTTAQYATDVARIRWLFGERPPGDGSLTTD